MRKVRRTKRAKRRKNARVIYLKRAKSWYEVGFTTEDIKRWHWLKTTGKPCSCDGCRNPRRCVWNKGERLTRQERNANLSFAEQLKDYYNVQDVSA